jgi:hypothetical protein
MLKSTSSIVNVSQITGVLPVVNGGTGVTTSTGTGNTVLSAAPTLSGNVTLSTGNLVIGTSGKGIDFSATPGTGTSELLADYEEGTWTPTITLNAGTLSGSVTSGTYTKVGRQVTVLFYLEVGVSVGASINGLSGLPFTVASGDQQPVGAIRETGVTGLMWEIITNASATTGTIRRYDNDAALTTGFKLVGSVSYFV